jgi:hypothetical protein
MVREGEMRGDLGNRERKDYLGKQRLIHCSRCKYHRRENVTGRVQRTNRYKDVDRESIRWVEEEIDE